MDLLLNISVSATQPDNFFKCDKDWVENVVAILNIYAVELGCFTCVKS